MSAPALEGAARRTLAAIEAAYARGDGAVATELELAAAMAVHRMWQSAGPGLRMMLELAVEDGDGQ